MKNKKGLSDVVTTLIIVLLVLAAIGIIWNPIKSLLTGSTDKFDQTKCLEFGLTSTKVANFNATPGFYNVTLKRSAAGDDMKIGAKFILFSGDTATDVLDTDQNGLTSGIGPLEVKTMTGINSGIVQPDKIQVTPYYTDTNTGEKVLCTTSTEFEFTTSS